MDMVEECPSKEQPEVEGMDIEDIDMMKDITVEVEVVKREHEGVCWRGIGSAMERRASANSSEMGGACEVGVFRSSHHICKSRFQLFDIA
jgi:hypothetical protein